MYITLMLIAIVTSIIGSICGIGGGVLIKPVLDAMQIMSVSAISFLAGCTVLSMAVVSVGKSIYAKRAHINKRTTPMLGVGAAVGGVVGKIMFNLIRGTSGDENLVGMVQAILLAAVTLATLVYMLFNDTGKIRTRHVTSLSVSILIGLLLGVISSFLGIGGGPINLAVLAFFFSMDAKEAASNSLCVILISQTASLLQTLLTHSVPDFNVLYLIVMTAGGVVGGMLGQTINRRLSIRQVGTLFNILLVVVAAVCIYNAVRFGLA